MVTVKLQNIIIRETMINDQRIHYKSQCKIYKEMLLSKKMFFDARISVYNENETFKKYFILGIKPCLNCFSMEIDEESKNDRIFSYHLWREIL